MAKVAIIRWQDAMTFGEQQFPAGTSFSPIRVMSVGFLVAEDDVSVTIALDAFQDGDYCMCETIPRRQIDELQFIHVEDLDANGTT